MGKKRNKPTKKANKNHIAKPTKKKISFIPLFVLIILIVFGFSSYIIVKSIKHASFYKDYIVFIEKTKVVLYPDITEKDEKANTKAWIDYMKRFMNQHRRDLSSLKSKVIQIENKIKEGKQEEILFLISETRNQLLTLVKNKNYNSQTIMMEDLLSLILEMEKTIDQKDEIGLMEQYQNFNTKFTFVIPVIIKSDVVLIGNLMDLLYKQALYQNMTEAKSVYKQVKSVFIRDYMDYNVK
jgi:hypothetical protein